MSLEQRKRVLELLNAALERPPEERSAFLDAACNGDGQPEGAPALRREVERLLAATEENPDFMEEPVFSIHARDPDAGRCVGPYKLVRLLGRGGMGTVHLAVREDDFQKRVALKLIKRGMDTDEIVRRFHNERQALARLEHPYVARLLDGGTTADGLPWFAMEHVEGEPIHRYCEARRLPTRQRLELFRKVCSAVQLAHRNLLVHRDIKPANILVTADGVPKLLDFGIAKLLQKSDDATFQTVATAPEGRPMTPESASPEQVRGESVTTATDVYGLGVLLYRLLTGRSPYGPSRWTQEELVRRICEEEPKRPSVVVRETGGRLSGDLDAIVLKALHKEPQRRYGSVEQLSEDVRRHLTGRPVVARRPTFAYRTGKLLRRHKLGVATLFLILAFAMCVTVLWQRARRGEEVALRSREAALRSKEEAEAVTDYLVDLFRASTPNRAQGETVTAPELLERGRKNLGELKDEPGTYATLASIIGRVFYDQGSYEEARQLLEESVRLRRRIDSPDPLLLADSLHYLAMVLYKQDDDEAARSLFREALAIRRSRLGDQDPEVLKTMSNLAAVLRSGEDYEEAAEIYRQILKVRQELHGPRHREVANTLHSLGAVLYSQGDHDEAERLLRQALAIRREVRGPEHTEVARTLNNLAKVRQARGDMEEAEALYREALEIQRKRAGNEHVETAATERNLAELLAAAGDPEEARALIEHALAVFRQTFHAGHRQIVDAESVRSSLVKTTAPSG